MGETLIGKTWTKAFKNSQESWAPSQVSVFEIELWSYQLKHRKHLDLANVRIRSLVFSSLEWTLSLFWSVCLPSLHSEALGRIIHSIFWRCSFISQREMPREILRGHGKKAQSSPVALQCAIFLTNGVLVHFSRRLRLHFPFVYPPANSPANPSVTILYTNLNLIQLFIIIFYIDAYSTRFCFIKFYFYNIVMF